MQINLAKNTDLGGRTSNAPIDPTIRTGSCHLAITTDIKNAYSPNPKISLFNSGATPITTATAMPTEMVKFVHQNQRNLDWYCDSHKADPTRVRAELVGERINCMPVAEKARECLWTIFSTFLSVLKVSEMISPDFDIGDFNSIHKAIIEAQTMFEGTEELQCNMPCSSLIQFVAMAASIDVLDLFHKTPSDNCSTIDETSAGRFWSFCGQRAFTRNADGNIVESWIRCSLILGLNHACSEHLTTTGMRMLGP